jgi:tRNA pseudouridine13 synthase
VYIAYNNMTSIREREEDDSLGRSPKRSRTEGEAGADGLGDLADATALTIGETSIEGETNQSESPSVLPPSHSLLSAPRHVAESEGSELRVMETDVGISEYVGHDIPKIEGIIKQR